MTPREGLTTVDSEIIALAEDEYAAAAEAARIEVREIHTAAEAAEAALLLDEVWSVDETGTNVLEPGLIVAFAHAGNYVSAAYSLDEPDEMIGVTIGFFGQPLGTLMHSHIAGVRHEVIGRGAGSAMKLHQRLWCLNLGITEMTWTFDPLVARNAYFNFQRLGVGMVEYLEDFYGQMRDGVNAGQASDRMVVSWPLDKPARSTLAEADDAFECLRSDDTGEPVVAEVPKEAKMVSLDIPSDIEALRGQDAELASRWRMALRDSLTALVADGWVLDTCLKGGTYLLHHP
ncbi:MAG: hypothetical protein L0G69_02760 [Brevibacterium sp.]|uniref:hypothetical protein n=1 Tax=Brevibacterium sandarakinum TaxID=629680 RepID=UPI00264FBD02|nr:hypothetical protein [Brevibacterium sandarakinum]MDN5585463.1 hypothetical protein [Brevibacterium sp.]MDN5657673.1 hypothetical protein [Brevibacterium sandarakinum]